jgi:16S rRNA (guanine527-N7)-methyltransferase
MHLTLVESVGKKAMFCQHIVRALGLEGVEVIRARAEDLGHDPAHREAYDWATARAVANLNVLAEYLLPLVRIEGTMLAQKLPQNNSVTNGVVPVHLPGVADDRYRCWWKVAASPPGILENQARPPTAVVIIPLIQQVRRQNQ